MEYDTIVSDYRLVTDTDIVKKFVQYPSIFSFFSNKSGSVLDVGCGSGLLSRELTKKAFHVSGYDISTEQIALAKKMAPKEGLSITYYVSNQHQVREHVKQTSDYAFSNMVLSMATSQKELEAFFSSTYDQLKRDGEFFSVTYNPGYQRLGQLVYNRIFSEGQGDDMIVEFYKGETFITKSSFGKHSRQSYELASKRAGFTDFKWVSLSVTKEGLKEYSKFFEGFEKDCPYVGFYVKK